MLCVRSLVSCENFGALGFWEVLRERKPRKFRSLDGLFTKWCKVRWTVGRPLRLCLEIETEKNKEQKKLKRRNTKSRRNWNGEIQRAEKNEMEKYKEGKNLKQRETKSRRNWNRGIQRAEEIKTEKKQRAGEIETDQERFPLLTFCIEVDFLGVGHKVLLLPGIFAFLQYFLLT